MQVAHRQFLSNLQRVQDLHSLHAFLKHQQQLSTDLSDLLRAEVVYVISALDKLIHELVRIGMLQSFNGNRPKTPKFFQFTVSAQTLDKIKTASIENIQNPNRPQLPENLPEYWFEQEIVLKHKAISYQAPDKIADGLSLIWAHSYKWQQIAQKMGSDETQVKTSLKNIENRRNQIVHEADINLFTGLKQEIDESDVQSDIDFIQKLGNAIFDCVQTI